MRILSVTGSRSDYSLMSKLFRLLSDDQDIEHHLFVTGMLLESDHADVLAKIRSDGFGTLHEAKTFSSSHDSVAMAKALGSTLNTVTDVISKLRPDFVVLQGDRGEMLAAGIAAAHLNVAIAHLSGGDRTGSIDDSIRNSLSKFAHLHFTTCQQSSQNLLEMGESELRIFQVGEPGLDVLMETELMTRAEVEAEFALGAGEKFILACQHPVTTEIEDTLNQIHETIHALRSSGLKTVFTYPNNDAGSEFIISALKEIENEPWVTVVKNLGSRRFLSTLKHASVLVGNSSSGIWEAPSFKTPVVNIGSRQYMRLRAGNVIEAEHNRDSILRAIKTCLLDVTFRAKVATVTNPYGDGKSAERVVSALKSFRRPERFIEKWFDTKNHP